MSSNILKKIVI